MADIHTGSFQPLFENQNYVALKNYLYNYLLRRRAIRSLLNTLNGGVFLDVGSGISPVASPDRNTVIYTDLSYLALHISKHIQRKGSYVTADVRELPFRSDAFSIVICSEVLEHVEQDGNALKEIARVIRPRGSLLLTFPHRHSYFSLDDRFVHHLRRYELPEITVLLDKAGLAPVDIQKVLGPLEKIITICSVIVFRCFNTPASGQRGHSFRPALLRYIAPIFRWLNVFLAFLVWLDAKIAPLRFASVILIRAEKRDLTS